jgi:hypothetical protein
MQSDSICFARFARLDQVLFGAPWIRRYNFPHGHSRVRGQDRNAMNTWATTVKISWSDPQNVKVLDRSISRLEQQVLRLRIRCNALATRSYLSQTAATATIWIACMLQ